jgi:endonuclease/exonuclease/phosphatase family metal-dependent hydrolase
MYPIPHPRRLPILRAVILCCLLTHCSGTGKRHAARTAIESRTTVQLQNLPVLPDQQPALPGFREIQTLTPSDQPIPAAVQAKVEKLFATPFVHHQKTIERSPQLATNSTLGPFIRVASWNIEKSLAILEVAEALKNREAFIANLKDRTQSSPKRLTEALRQYERLITADILFLQEMDLGVDRSGYHYAAQKLADALNMHLCYAAKQIELEPVIEPPADLQKDRYHGLFGLAILSRFPIVHAECNQLNSQAYDWYAREMEQYDFTEKARRTGARWLFQADIQREIKYGGQMFFRVDVQAPGVPGGRLALIHNHLEIKTNPRGRKQQLDEILSNIRDIPYPVIMAGDYNTALSDISPVSTSRLVKRTAKNPQTAITVGLRLLAVSNLINLGRTSVNLLKNLHNPTALHIPILLPNPSKELFDSIEKHRFADGQSFDVRGDRQRSINGTRSKFGNSHERNALWHTPTFRVPRPLGPIGKTRLDWIFVKPPADQPNESYRLRPHFGETLTAFDLATRNDYSDHRPIVTDLPIGEPQLKR